MPRSVYSYGSSLRSSPKLMPILEGAKVRIVFYDLRGQENPISPRTEESIGITFSEERSDDPYEQAPLGMLVTYTDPYEQASLGMNVLYVK